MAFPGFASLTLRPGVNTEATPAALRAGYAQSNLGRFRSGFFEKLGGWIRFYPFAIGGVPRALQAWLDLNEHPWLGIGTTTTLDVIDQSHNLTVITPQTFTSNVAPNFSTTISSPTVTINDSNVTNPTTFDVIELKTPVAVGGLILSGVYAIQTIISATQYTITAASNATSNVTNGGAVPSFATTSGSSQVSVTLAAHGLVAGNTVVFPIATTVGGIAIQGTYTVLSVTSASVFVIAGSNTASSSTSGSMNSGNAQILYYIGLGPVSGSGTGYSFSTYSSGPYSGTGASSGSPQTGTAITATDWTLDNWNDRLMACPANGGIYTWEPNSGFQNATIISGAPPYNSGIFVAAPRLALVAYGASVTKNIGIAQDPLVYKISDINDYTFWKTNVTNTNTNITSQAFESRIPTGSAIKAGMAAPNNLLLWTDLDLWAINYVNLPTIWTQTKIGANCGTISRHSVVQMSGVIYWMGRRNFHAMAGGAPQVMPCTVWDAVFQNINNNNLDKCFAETVTSFNETWFFYPSSAASDGNCDSYAKVNVIDGSWDYGTLPRSIGIDQSVVGDPVMATPTGLLYSHENGYNADGQPLIPVMKTGWFYLDDSEQFVTVDQFWPDFKWTTFDGSTTSAMVQITFYVADNFTETPRTYGPYSMSTATAKLDVRFRGRVFAFLITSSDVGSFWRLGQPKFRTMLTGRR